MSNWSNGGVLSSEQNGTLRGFLNLPSTIFYHEGLYILMGHLGPNPLKKTPLQIQPAGHINEAQRKLKTKSSIKFLSQRDIPPTLQIINMEHS